MKLTVLIPVYDDWESLGQLLDGIHATLADRPWSYEVVVVDDASPTAQPATAARSLPANCTDNFALLTAAEQRALVEVGRRCAPVAMVYRQDLYRWWVQQHAPPNSALDDFRRQECRPLGQVGVFTLLRLAATPPSAPSPDWTHCARVERTSADETGQPTGRIAVRVSPAFRPTGAVLLDGNGQALTPRLPVSAATDGSPGRLAVTLPDAALLRTHPAQELCLRLCDDAGRRLTTVPFFVPAE